jgi:hypothetical protein
MIVFDEVVVGIAREGQRVQPKGVDRRIRSARQPRSPCRKVWKIVPQDVVADQVSRLAKARLNEIQRGIYLSSATTNYWGSVAVNRGQIEDTRRFRIDLNVNGQAICKERYVMLDSLGQKSPTKFVISIP